MNIPKQIGDELARMATVLKPYAEQGWEVLLRQQFARGIGYALAAMISIILWVFFLSKAWPHAKETDAADQEAFARGLVVFALILLAAMAIGWTWSAFAHFWNPAYYAIQELLPK